MRWNQGRRSKNVEDRRGRRTVKGAAGLGLGGLLIMLIVGLLGGDPTGLLKGLLQGASQTSAAASGTARSPEEDQLAEFVSVVLANTEDVWSEQFANMGRRYEPPTLVLFTDQVQSSCGLQRAAVGPFYCPADQKAYIDLGFYRELKDKLRGLKIDELTKEFGVGENLIRDIVQILIRPGRDPRYDLPKPIFRRGILKIEELKPGLQLKAQVLNVVDFGVFVDIGLGDSSLIHISQLSRKYIRDPHRFFSIGDILNVWVKEIDVEKRRVALTAVRPDSERKPRPRSDNRKSRPTKRKDAAARKERPKRKPKKPVPAKPITKSMVEGSEPMRSFSDLAQFYKIRDDDDGPQKK